LDCVINVEREKVEGIGHHYKSRSLKNQELFSL